MGGRRQPDRVRRQNVVKNRITYNITHTKLFKYIKSKIKMSSSNSCLHPIFIAWLVFLGIVMVVASIIAITAQPADDMQITTPTTSARSGGPQFSWTNTKQTIAQHNKNCTVNIRSISDKYPEVSYTDVSSRKRRRRATNLQIERQNRIVGGGKVNIRDFPWLISLQVHNAHVCGGSLILSDWVLTAAHCTNVYDQASDWTALAGSSNSNDKGQTTEQRDVIKLIEHADFEEDTYNNDIALMKLKSGLTYGDTIQPLCFPSLEEHSFTTKPESWLYENEHDLECFVSGFGVVYAGGPPSGSLRAVNVPQVGRTQCNKWFDTETNGLASDWVFNNMVCAGHKEGKLDGCQGDSGGPLSCVRKTANKEDARNEIWYASGIMSWGINCAKPKMPGVYTKTILYYNWVWKNIAENI